MTELSSGTNSPTIPSAIRNWMLALVIAAVTATVFASSINARFVQWDDDINIYRNPHIQGFSERNIEWMLSDSTRVRRYMPLGWLGFALIHQVGGLNPAYYHAANVMLHSANAVVLFFLLQKLLRLLAIRNPRWEKGAIPWCAAFGALLWSAHPMRVEVVAWASGFIYCEAVFFLLAAALSYLHFVELKRDGSTHMAYYWIAVVAFGASLLAYPLAFGFLLVLPVLDFAVLGQWPSRRNVTQRLLVEKIPFLAEASVVLIVTIWARVHAQAMWTSSSSLADFPIFSRVMQAFYIWAYYVWKPWVPFDLAPVYTTLVDFQPNQWPFLLSAMGVVLFTIFLWWKRRRCGFLIALWFCHLVMLVPMLGLTEHPHYPSDRYSYVVGFLWSIFVAMVLLQSGTPLRARLVSILLAVAVLGTLGTLSVRQTRVWKDSVTLFRYTLSTLGNDPYRADIQWRLAFVLAEQGKIDEALEQYQRSLQLKPEVAHVQQAIGSLLLTTGQHEKALVHLQKALSLGMDNVELRRATATILQKQGKVAAAVQHYWDALLLNPNDAGVLDDLAWILATSPDEKVFNGREALRLSTRACELNRQPVAKHITTLAAAYAAVGRFDEAVLAATGASDLARTAGLTNLVELNRRALEQYRSGRPYREPVTQEPMKP